MKEEQEKEEHNLTNSLASGLFTELASETRMLILEALGKKPAKLSSIARELNITVQDAHRNLDRMADSGLIMRSEGTMFLTEYGKLVLKQMPYFRFLSKYRRFFEEHSLEGILPDKFISRVGELYSCKIVSGTTTIFQIIKRLETSADRFVKVMVSQAWPEEGAIFLHNAERGVETISIIGLNTIFPKNVKEDIMPQLVKPVAAGIMKRRMIDKVSIALYIADDKEAGIMFPRRYDEEVDMNTLLLSNDPSFCEWCSDLFDHVWKNAKTFDENKLKVADY
jgi:predicted transcriptional regulator